MALFGLLCALAAVSALLGLAYVAADAVPPVTGTVALVLTIAALGLAILH
ncbi:hypothetical protein ACIQPT_34760 [Streptomyces sp. NPDC091289]